MVEIATVTSKGQVTLPVSIRKKLGLRKGSRIVFLDAGEGEEVRLIKEADLERKFEIFDRRRGELGLDPERLQVLVKEAKGRLWKEHHAHSR